MSGLRIHTVTGRFNHVHPIYICFILPILSAFLPLQVSADTNYGDSCNIHLTVSSNDRSFGFLELNWKQNCFILPQKIHLFGSDPTVHKEQTPLFTVDPRDIPDGFAVSNINISSVTKFPGGWNEDSENGEEIIRGPQCLPFWIASVTNDQFEELNCLKIQPTWMSDLREINGIMPLSKMLIPGTHNSGSFYGPNQIIQGTRLMDFALTQDQSIWNQLVFGIRYLDLRVGFYEDPDNRDIPDSDKLWINHDRLKITPLKPILKSIKKFIEKSKDEIIIMDIHRLPVGFYLIDGKPRLDRHEKLINVLFKEFGDIALEFHPTLTNAERFNLRLLLGPRMKDIWESGKRIIICYPEINLTSGKPWLWPGLQQMWGDRQTPEDLEQYIEDVMLTERPPLLWTRNHLLWAIMAELTPSAADIILNPTNNLKNLADSVNRNVTRWVEATWWPNANIIATDFFLGNNLIDLAIQTTKNKNKSQYSILR